MLIADPTAEISNLADIECSSRGSCITVGPRVHIDAFVKVKWAGGTAGIEIGEGSYINSGTVIYSGNGVTIGRYVLIAANCVLAPVNHEYKTRERLILEQRFAPSRGGIVIEDDVWLGAGVIVLDGAVIRRGAVVGAASLVRSELEAYGVFAGNPARKIGSRA